MARPAKTTGKRGSRVSQRKSAAAKSARKNGGKPLAKSTKKKSGPKSTKRTLVVQDFDLSQNHNGAHVDVVEGREARLPMVIQGMRECRSARSIAADLNVSHVTIARDKQWVLEEAWELRQGMMSVWLEEQLQQYDYLLEKLHAELMVKLEYRIETEENGTVFNPKLDAEGNQLEVVNPVILAQIITIMDKVNGIKGLTSTNINVFALGGKGGSDSRSNQRDAQAAGELLDFLKSSKGSGSETASVS